MNPQHHFHHTESYFNEKRVFRPGEMPSGLLDRWFNTESLDSRPQKLFSLTP